MRIYELAKCVSKKGVKGEGVKGEEGSGKLRALELTSDAHRCAWHSNVFS